MERIKELREICQSDKRKHRSLSDWGYLQHRKFSIYITFALLKIFGRKINPNCVSVFNLLFGMALLWLIATAKSQPFFVLLMLLFYFSFLLDKVDGEIARYQKRATLKGVYLDEIYHSFVLNGFILAVAASRGFLFLGVAGFFLFFLNRYLHKIRYFIYAQKYKLNRDKFLIDKDLSKPERWLVGFLNFLPVKLSSLARRQDIFWFLVVIVSVFFFESAPVWFWLLVFWLTMSAVYFLRFLFLHYFLIDSDIQLIDQNKL